MRRWGMVAVVALASCGGGGDASTGWAVIDTGGNVSNEGVTTTQPGGSITLIPEGVSPGTYTIPARSTVSGMLLVHPDGHTLATAHVPSPVNTLDSSGTILFAGPLPSPDIPTGTVTLVYATPKVPSQVGTATASLSSTTLDGVPAITATLTNATVFNLFDPQTYEKVEVPTALHLLPMAKLAGHYIDVASGQDLQVTSDGAVSGSYAANCTITAMIAAYDPETTLFRMTATLDGTGCAYWLPGTREYLGNLGASDSGHVMLNAFAISGALLATLVFTHPQQLGTY